MPDKRGHKGGARIFLVKGMERNHHKISHLEFNHQMMNDQLLHELLKREKAAEIRTVILVEIKKKITDGLQK